MPQKTSFKIKQKSFEVPIFTTSSKHLLGIFFNGFSQLYMYNFGCEMPIEDIEHILTKCLATTEVRKPLLDELAKCVQLLKSNISFESIRNNSLSNTIFVRLH